MRHVLILLLALLILSACAAPAAEPEAEAPAPPSQEAPGPEEESPEGPKEDDVLLSLDAPLAGGRALTLEAVGRVEDEDTCGVREIRVYDGGGSFSKPSRPGRPLRPSGARAWRRTSTTTPSAGP